MTLSSSGSLVNLATALAKAQAEMPIIAFDKQVSYKNINFWYATLSALIQGTKPVLSRHGLTVIQLPSVSGNVVRVEAILLHETGEYLQGSIETVLRSEDPKELGACISYLRRYQYSSLLGLCSDSDTDAQIISERYVGSPEQKPWLRDVLTAMGITERELMAKVSQALITGNFEMTEDSVVKVLEIMRR